MNNLIDSFSVSKVFIWSFIKLSSPQKSVSLNNCGICGFFGNFNGFVKGVSSGVADEIFDKTFGDSKDTVDVLILFSLKIPFLMLEYLISNPHLAAFSFALTWWLHLYNHSIAPFT